MVELVRVGRKYADLEKEFGCTGWRSDDGAKVDSQDDGQDRYRAEVARH